MSDLRGTRAPAKVRFGSGGKILAAVVVLVAVGALAGLGYTSGQFNVQPKSVVTNSELPTALR